MDTRARLCRELFGGIIHTHFQQNAAAATFQVSFDLKSDSKKKFLCLQTNPHTKKNRK